MLLPARKGAAATARSGSRAWTPAIGSNLLFILPATFLAVFFGWPLVQVLLTSVLDPSPGIENYEHVLGQPAYLRVLINTLKISAVVTVLCLLLSYPVAVAVARARGSVFNFLIIVVLVPFWTSAVIRAFAWMILLQRQGPINSTLAAWGLIEAPLPLFHSSTGIYIGMVHVLMPFMILPLVSAFRGIDKTYMQAASLLGASPLRAFLHVYLPLSMPGVTAGCSLVFIMALGFYIVPALLGGSRDTMIAVLIEQQVNVVVDWGVASAVASILLIVTVLLTATYEKITDRFGGRGLL